MVTDWSDTYLGFISDEYEVLKHSLDVESFKRNGCGIDEDIYHDTIMRCIDKIKNSELTKDQVLNYIFVSYNNNVKREREYARNKYREYDDITESTGGLCVDDFEYYDLIEALKAKFGNHDTQLFLDWCDGISVREINEENGTTNFRYRLEKMRNFVKEIIKE